MRRVRLALYWLAWRVLDPLGIPVGPKEKTMKRDEQTYCDCGEVLGDDEDVCDYCGAPRPGFCAEGYDPEDFEDEDQRLDDPRHGQAAGVNRENRGRRD